VLKWYGRVLGVGDNRRLTPLFYWSQEGRKRRGRPEMMWEREVEKVMKQKKSLTPKEAVKR
jgi:hypothetical protein